MYIYTYVIITTSARVTTKRELLRTPTTIFALNHMHHLPSSFSGKLSGLTLPIIWLVFFHVDCRFGFFNFSSALLQLPVRGMLVTN